MLRCYFNNSSADKSIRHRVISKYNHRRQLSMFYASWPTVWSSLYVQHDKSRCSDAGFDPTVAQSRREAKRYVPWHLLTSGPQGMYAGGVTYKCSDETLPRNKDPSVQDSP